MANGTTPYKARFGQDFTGPIIPLGAEVTFKPISDKDISRTRKFGDTNLPGVFLGYSQQAGGGWSGDLIIAD